MRNHVLVGTFHKTGTAWMESVFGCFSKTASITLYYNLRLSEQVSTGHIQYDEHFRHCRQEVEAQNQFGIFFDYHSLFPNSATISGCKGFVVIRDPRDVLISAANYHPRSQEEWLHVPRKEFGGMTYSEKINSYSTLEDRVLFESDNSGANTIKRMATFECGNIFEKVKYEVLIHDEDMQYWSMLLQRIGFENDEVISGRNAFWTHSLFGGRKGHKSVHINDGSADQWRNTLPVNIIDILNQKFTIEIEVLGYPIDSRETLATES